MSENRPLVTFFVIAHNFERFVRESVEAAFAQTYSPLEIILSDDCSQDGTYEIMRQMAAEYRGPHRIILNRSSECLGMGRHITRLFELAHGELHIISSADDVSLPERTEIVFRAWDASARRAGLIYSRFNLIDAEGRKLENDHGNAKANWNSVVKSASGRTASARADLSNGFETGWIEAGESRFQWIEQAPNLLDLVGRRTDVVASGCAAASSAKLFRTFGAMLPEIVFEDQVLIFRSALVGPILFIDMPLVKYRKHGANLTTVGSPKRDRGTLIRWNIAGYNQFQRDLQVAAKLGIIEAPFLGRLEREIARQLSIFKTQCECLEARRIHAVNMTWKLVKSGAGPRTIIKEIAGMLRRPVRASA